MANITYRTQSSDTSVEAELFQLELLRRAGPARRLQQVRSLTATTRQLSWQTLNRLHTYESKWQAALAFVELVYGSTISHELVTIKPITEENLMLSQDLIEAIKPVVQVLEDLAVNYLIGGSVASSILGIPRSTNDADLVADLQSEHIAPFIAALEADYYVSEVAFREALARKSSFNLIHQPTMLKVDIFIPKDEPFERSELSRAIANSSPDFTFKIASPEDMVLRKLAWYRAGGETSEKQWLDVLGILKMQIGQLDRAYLQDWATRLNLSDLLDRILQEAGYKQ